jgi:hypoxanthine phosphoribosyltransferase
MFNEPHIRPLVTAHQIAERVREMGAEIARDYSAENRVPHAVCVLKGACMFLGDLMRSVELPMTIDFIAVSSYGGSTTSSGEVRLVKDLDQSVQRQDVLIVEDIVDTGLTLSYLVDLFWRRGASSVRIATLLDKKARRRISLPVDYVGFEIPDEFVIGYGLDFDERYRNLPYVGVAVDPSRL